MCSRRLSLVLLAVAGVLPSLALPGGADRYGATLQSATWTLQAGKTDCSLRHTIPNLGEARFSQAAGGTLAFTLVIPLESQLSKRVVWRAVPPAWKLDAEAVDLGHQALIPNVKTLELPADDALRLFAQFESGMSVDFIFSDGEPDRGNIIVSLSAVRFFGQTRAFQSCINGLIKLAATSGKAETGKVRAKFPIPFTANSFEVNATARQILGDLAREYRINKSQNRILIAGYTDAQESPESPALLAQRRARELKGYLVRRGLPAERIEIRAAEKPASRGADKSAEPPRATIWLVN